MAPAAWVKRLVTLCDQAPATPYNVVKIILEKELGRSIDEIFERIDVEPLGSASIAQVFLSYAHILLSLNLFTRNWSK